MTTDYPYSLASLAKILSALDGERRNPNTSCNAIKAIERAASRLGRDSDDIFDAADGLLSGRLSETAWLAQLRDEGRGPANIVTEPPAEQAAGDEPTETLIMPNAEPLAATPRRRSGALKKKLGLTIISEKAEGAARVYRIQD